MHPLPPLDLAIQKISETRSLLQTLIHSSESFDYPKAKQALTDLKSKIVELERAQRQLQERTATTASPLAEVIPFPVATEA